MMTFVEGATLVHHTGDKDVKRAEIRPALEDFDARVPAAVDRAPPGPARRGGGRVTPSRTTSRATC